MTSYNLDQIKDLNDLANKSADLIADFIKSVLKKKDRCKIALSGGTTPRLTYSLLKDKQLDWELVDIFLGDERWVDPSSQSSNSLMIRETLFSNGLAKKAQFYPVPILNCSSPQESANEYSKLIEKVCTSTPPQLDIAILGLGDDGHTASLFPGTHALEVKDRITTISSGKGQERITLSAPFLSTANKILFMVTGSSKQTALARLLDTSESVLLTPAKLIHSPNPIHILADCEACRLFNSNNHD